MSDTIIYRGQIVAWLSSRFFGYIKRSDTSTEHFFHGNEVQNKNEIALGSFVEYELGAPNRIGRPPQAVRVRIIKGLADLVTEAAQ